MSSIRTADLAPLAMSILGMDASSPASVQRRGSDAPAEQPSQSPSRSTRASADRRTSHYNSFQTKCSPSTDSPPSYATHARLARFPVSARHLDNGDEILPRYTATVLREGKMYMRVERISPFQSLPKQEWRSVYVILRGTQLCIYKVKTSHFGTDSVHGPGKLIRKYTLQHAEVGVGTDVSDHVLVPVSRLAHLIPAIARRRAFYKDPELFRCDKQHALRLRVETDQILLADCSEEVVFNWVQSICAGIDIAFPIDERSLPKQCTVPRRRRQRRTEPVSNLEDRQLVEEQERILREMYPSLARSVDENVTSNDTNSNNADNTNDHVNDDSLRRFDTVDFADSAGENLMLTTTATNLNDQQDNEDIDLSIMAEDPSSLEATISRPQTTRSSTATTLASSLSSSSSTSPTNFDADGKWAPPHPRSASQQFRYTRRCMPTLLFDSPRCSSIVMCHGRRLHINHRMDMLEEWELQPPTYDAHDFSSSQVAGNDGAPLCHTSTNTSRQDAASMTRSGSDLDIQVVRSDDNGTLGSVLEKMQTKSSIVAKTEYSSVSVAAQVPATTQRHSKIDEHSSMQQEFAAMISF